MYKSRCSKSQFKARHLQLVKHTEVVYTEEQHLLQECWAILPTYLETVTLTAPLLEQVKCYLNWQ